MVWSLWAKGLWMLSMPPTRESAPCVPEPWTRVYWPDITVDIAWVRDQRYVFKLAHGIQVRVRCRGSNSRQASAWNICEIRYFGRIDIWWGPQFKADKTQECLREWGIRHRITSVANPHANCRAELGVKTVKCMFMDNVSGTAPLEVDKFQGALLVYRNTVDPETKASPAIDPVLSAPAFVFVRVCLRLWLFSTPSRYRPLRHTNFHSVTTRKIKI